MLIYDTQCFLQLIITGHEWNIYFASDKTSLLFFALYFLLSFMSYYFYIITYKKINKSREIFRNNWIVKNIHQQNLNVPVAKNTINCLLKTSFFLLGTISRVALIQWQIPPVSCVPVVGLPQGRKIPQKDYLHKYNRWTGRGADFIYLSITYTTSNTLVRWW